MQPVRAPDPAPPGLVGLVRIRAATPRQVIRGLAAQEGGPETVGAQTVRHVLCRPRTARPGDWVGTSGAPDRSAPTVVPIDGARLFKLITYGIGVYTCSATGLADTDDGYFR